MIDIRKEKLISFREAGEFVPDGPKCYETVRRWSKVGSNGKKLESTRIGGRIYTSREAVLRYLEATNKPKVPKVKQPQLPLQPNGHDRLAFFRDLGCY